MDSPPPYCLNTSTNIGKTFFRLLGKCFPKTHQLHKFFNRNKVRVIYSSFPNFKSMINGKLSSSNCRDKTSCPLNGSCQHKNFLCSGRVSTPYIKQTICITLVLRNIHLEIDFTNIIILSSTCQREIQQNFLISYR